LADLEPAVHGSPDEARRCRPVQECPFRDGL
jgi:hypothetical protein